MGRPGGLDPYARGAATDRNGRSHVERPSLAELSDDGRFVARHIGPDAADRRRMLEVVGAPSLDALVDEALPDELPRAPEPRLPGPLAEHRVRERLRGLADRNRPVRSYIGLGYHGTITPPVIRRNVLEDPAWYTAYTPYQSEISQGRLRALLIFQTMVRDLTGMDLANASLLDEATAAAEAMALCHRVGEADGDVFQVAPDCHPQTVAVLRTRARPLGLRVRVADPRGQRPGPDVLGVLLQQPGSDGTLHDDRALIDELRERDVLVAVAADLLGLTLVTPPGEQGADAVVGTTQRFGVPMMYGGPHAAFLATREQFRRSLPGRLVGVSRDAAGRRAHRLALQTREQHIRRERATSNICTSQVLLAVVAAMYGVYHGPEGLRRIARRTHRLAAVLAHGVERPGVDVLTERFFDTVTIRVPGRAADVCRRALMAGYNLRRVDDDTVAVALDETTTAADVDALLEAFGSEATTDDLAGRAPERIPDGLRRDSEFLTHPVFHEHRSETAMLRFLRRLSDRDVALDRSMIPLGSCTMKLNATTEMEPVTWPAFAELHPLAPPEQAAGIRRLISELETDLAELTGFHAVSVQPNAGSQGELAGLLAIRGYHEARGQDHRDRCLVPASAHGTNAASAVMAGLEVTVVDCDEDGNIDLDHLRELVGAHADDLAGLMVTYPSTHGVYEPTIREVTDLVHDHGGQVYLDGANLNELAGLVRPADLGADVAHLNLHKTFCIPHGGGGPGVGPVGVAEHLAPHLPNHPLQPDAGPDTGIGPVSQAPWGSAGILPISWAYLRLMGPGGLREATRTAVLIANYVAARLDDHYPVLYRGPGGRVAHECIVDLRPLADGAGITNEDVAKRLIDYGLHAPTMSFPVRGTLMIEPTESEPLVEVDRFCDAMIAIRREIARVESGEWPPGDNPLVNAPHTATALAGEWSHPYSRRQAAFPLGDRGTDKYWPPVARVDNAFGDRNLHCACPPVDAYREASDAA